MFVDLSRRQINKVVFFRKADKNKKKAREKKVSRGVPLLFFLGFFLILFPAFGKVGETPHPLFFLAFLSRRQKRGKRRQRLRKTNAEKKKKKHSEAELFFLFLDRRFFACAAVGKALDVWFHPRPLSSMKVFELWKKSKILLRRIFNFFRFFDCPAKPDVKNGFSALALFLTEAVKKRCWGAERGVAGALPLHPTRGKAPLTPSAFKKSFSMLVVSVFSANKAGCSSPFLENSHLIKLILVDCCVWISTKQS